MEHPRKRRRIDLLSDSTDDNEVYFPDDTDTLHPEVQQRLEIRDKFKSRLENIFEKYSRDFNGVGDEIDLVTGQIVVDNGHLLHMQVEDDVGDELSDPDTSSVSATDDTSLPLLALNQGLVIGAQQIPANGQTWETLYTFPSLPKQFDLTTKSTSNSIPQAVDPIWQTPDIPEINFQARPEYDHLKADSGPGRKDRIVPQSKKEASRRKNARSPGGSLWSYTGHRKRGRPPLSQTRMLPNAFAPWSNNDGQFESELAHEGHGHTNNYVAAASEDLWEYPPELGSMESFLDGYSGQQANGPYYANSKLPHNNAEFEGSHFEIFKAAGSIWNSQMSPASRNSHLNLDSSRKSADAVVLTSNPEEIPLENMWIAFPAIGTPQAVERTKFNNKLIMTGLGDSETATEPTWQSQIQNIPSPVSLVPYGRGPYISIPGSCKKPVAPSTPQTTMQVIEDTSSEAVLAKTSSVAKDAHTLDEVLADIETGSSVSSVSMDLMALGSDNMLLYPDHPPLLMERYSDPLQTPQLCSEGVDQNDNVQSIQDAFPAEIMNLEDWERSSPVFCQNLVTQPMPAILSIPNTTQESSSQIPWSTNMVTITEPTKLPRQVQEAQETNDNQLCLSKNSRQSSPLSSMSSSDPRIANSSQMSNAELRRSDHKEIADTFSAKPSQAQERQSTPKLPDTAIPHLQLPQSQIEDQQITERDIQGRSDERILHRSSESFQISNLPTSPNAKHHDNYPADDSVPRRGQQSNIEDPAVGLAVSTTKPQSRSVLQSESTNITNLEVNQILLSASVALAKSSAMLEEARKRRSSAVSNHSIGLKLCRDVHQASRPYIPVRPRTSMAITNPVSPDVPSLVSSIAKNQSARTNHSKPSKNVEPHPLTGQRWPLQKILSQKPPTPGQVRPVKGQNNVKLAQTTTSIQCQSSPNSDSDSDREALRSRRETTPIDTFCYILADPWPSEPLLGDRTAEFYAPTDKCDAKANPNFTGLSKSNSTDLTTAVVLDSKHVTSKGLDKTQPSRHGAALRAGPKGLTNRNVVLHRPGLSKPEKVANSASALLAFESLSGSEHRSEEPLEPSIPSEKHQVSHQIRKIRNIRSKENMIKAPLTKARPSTPAPSKVLKSTDRYQFPRIPGEFAVDGSAMSPKMSSPVYNEGDILDEFGRGRPLTRANLLSLDEIPSTSQNTVISFLDSQACCRPSQKARTDHASNSVYQSHPHRQSSTPGGTCGADGFRCGRRYCFNCTSRAATQDEIEF